MLKVIKENNFKNTKLNTYTKKNTKRILFSILLVIIINILLVTNIVFGKVTIEGKSSVDIKKGEEITLDYKIPDEKYYIQIQKTTQTNNDVVKILEHKTDNKNYNIAKLKIKGENVGNTKLSFRVMYADTTEIKDELRYKVVSLDINVYDENEANNTNNSDNTQENTVNSDISKNTNTDNNVVVENVIKSNEIKQNLNNSSNSNDNDLNESEINSKEELDKITGETNEESDTTYEELERTANESTKVYRGLLFTGIGFFVILLIYIGYRLFNKIVKRNSKRK